MTISCTCNPALWDFRCGHMCVFLPLGELGDCDPLEHSPELVSEFRFSPKQSEAMEADIFGRWLELRWVEAPLPAPVFDRLVKIGVCPAAGHSTLTPFFVCHMKHLGAQRLPNERERNAFFRCFYPPAGASKFHSPSFLLLLCIRHTLTGLHGGLRD